MTCRLVDACWDIANWTPKNKIQWNFNQNTYILIKENPFEHVVCEMAAIYLGLNVLKIFE